MAYGGRLDELRAQLQRDRGLATAADQVSAGRGLSPRPLRRRLPLPAAGPARRRGLTAARSLPPHRPAAPRCTGPARPGTPLSPTCCWGSGCPSARRTTLVGLPCILPLRQAVMK
ncbi:hypothetical protein LUU34_01075600 [Aix galericulata]|nr:hypothetical protein LUU34_01075600 [Aix galericulata]